MSGKPSPLKILAAGAAWRLFGARGSAEALLDAIADDDEQNRMLAGMSLVKAGRRSFDLIESKIVSGDASASALRLLPDIDEQRARPVLCRIVEGGPEGLRDTARQCIDLLDRINASESEAD